MTNGQTVDSAAWNDSWMNVNMTQLLGRPVGPTFPRMNTCWGGNPRVTPPPPIKESTQTIKMESFAESLYSIGWMGDLIGLVSPTVSPTVGWTFTRYNCWFNRLNKFDMLDSSNRLDRPVGRPFTRRNCWDDRSVDRSVQQLDRVNAA